MSYQILHKISAPLRFNFIHLQICKIMRIKYFFLITLGLLFFSNLFSQTKPQLQNFNFNSSKLENKWLYGIAFNNSWTTLSGLEGLKPFIKPSLGFHARVEYYISPNIGLSSGIGFQQRGFGVVNLDDKSGENPDSTYRQRFRIGNISVPIQLILRQNNFLFKDAKLSLGVGFIPSYVNVGKDVFHSVEDGFHDINIITDRYKRFDAPLRIGGGLDVNVNGTSLFRIHFNVDFGLRKVFKGTDGTFSGRHRLYGLELSSLF